VDQVCGSEVGGCGDDGKGLGEGAAACSEGAPFGEDELVGRGAENGGDGEEGHAGNATWKTYWSIGVSYD